jgi:hypothetical protein
MMSGKPRAVFADRYEVIRQLGEGGMGVVYLAHDRNLDCEVVIKLPRPAAMAEPGFAERFTREIRALVQMAHPHVVKILDVGTQVRMPFAVMQFLSGGSLRERGVPSSVPALAGWLPAIATALDFVHQQGYLHRDVKPANILFDAHGNAYLSDFGLAKVLATAQAEKPAEQLTGAGLVVGTAEYMAPEMIMGTAIDGRADQYALGVTVYEMLAGHVPFDGPNATSIMVKHTTARLPGLLSVAPHLSEPLARAVERGLSKDPRHRYAGCIEFATAVLTAAGLGGSGALPRPSSAQGSPSGAQGPRGTVLLSEPAPVRGTLLTNPAPEVPASGAGSKIAATRLERAEDPAAANISTPPAPMERTIAATRLERAEDPVAPKVPTPPAPVERPIAATRLVRDEERPSAKNRTPPAREEPTPARPSARNRAPGSPSGAKKKKTSAVRPPLPSKESTGDIGGILKVVGICALALVVGIGTLIYLFSRSSSTKDSNKTTESGTTASGDTTESGTKTGDTGTTKSTTRHLFQFAAITPRTVRVGESERIPIRVTRKNYPGPVEMTCLDLPPGVKARQFNLAPGMEETVLVLDADNTVTTRAVAVRIEGTVGRDREETTFTLNLLGPPKLLIEGSQKGPPFTVVAGGTTKIPLEVVRQDCADQPVLVRVSTPTSPRPPFSVRISPRILAPEVKTFEVELDGPKRVPPSQVGKMYQVTVIAELASRRVQAQVNLSVRIE